MKVNIITYDKCVNIDSETGEVVNNQNVKWRLTRNIFYIEQDGALKLPEDDNYTIHFDPNEVKAGDFIFASYEIGGRAHLILIKDEELENLVNILREQDKKEALSCGDCIDCCPEDCGKNND